MKVHLFKTMKRKHTWELISTKGACFNRITCTTCGETRTTAYSPDAEWIQPGCYRIAVRDKLRKGDLLIAGSIIGEYRQTNEDGTISLYLGGVVHKAGVRSRYMDVAIGKWERWH